jgi:hypothetical protein
MRIAHEEREDCKQHRKEKAACEGGESAMRCLPVTSFEEEALASDG